MGSPSNELSRSETSGPFVPVAVLVAGKARSCARLLIGRYWWTMSLQETTRDPEVSSAPSRSSASIQAILPAFNEGDNLPSVLTELAAILDTTFEEWQILVMDDGSTDGTPKVLRELSPAIPQLKWIRIPRRSGKSNALQVAFAQISTDLVLLMDADGQDDPNEIPSLVEHLDGGVDLVTGRRGRRRDRAVKRITSKLYNWCTSRLTGIEGSDFNSGFKLMRRDVALSVNVYGELHRYIPVLAAWRGFEVAEVEVNHRERLHGESKFGRNRFWRGLFDLVTVKFIVTYDGRPFHLIGGLGLALGAVGGGLLVWMLVERILGSAVGDRPALLVGILLCVVGVQLISVGLLAELMVSLNARRSNDRSYITGP